MTIHELLLPENFIKAVQRLCDSPDHLNLFIEKGIEKHEVMANNVGLTEDGRLFTPILAAGSAVGAFFILPSLELGTYELMTHDIIGNVGTLEDFNSSTVIVVDTFLELLFFKRQFGNVVMFPQGTMYRPVFKRFREVIFAHYNPQVMLQFPRRAKCYFLTTYYNGGELPYPQYVSFEDSTLVKSNPFTIEGKLHFLLGGRFLQIVNSENSYSVLPKGEDTYNATLPSGKLFLNTIPIYAPFVREKDLDTQFVHTALTDWLLTRLSYLNRYQIDIVAYYIMYLWIYPHFDLNLNLNLVFTSNSVKHWSFKSLEWLAPSKKWFGNCPAIYYMHGDSLPFMSAPHLIMSYAGDANCLKSMPALVIDETKQLRPYSVTTNYYLRNLLVNWALDFELGTPFKIHRKLSPISTILSYLVKRIDDLGIFQSHFEKSLDKLEAIKKGECDNIPIHI